MICVRTLLTFAACICLTALALDSLDTMAPPLEGLRAGDIHDMFDELHNGHPHRAIDIMAARGTPVRAAVSGTIVRLFLSKAGGNTIYQFDQNGMYCYYYAHLDRYEDSLREGARVEKGALIGYVGVTGNARPDAPHLHFEISKLGQEKQWWKSTPLNPYQPMLDAIRRTQRR